jgi:hypothetical protein
MEGMIMASCIHAEVCKFKMEVSDEACSSTEICKYFDDGTLGTPIHKKPRGRKAKEEEQPGEGDPKISDKAYKRAYATLKYREKVKLLTENEQRVMDNLKQMKHGRNHPISEEQKLQIIEMAKRSVKSEKEPNE